MRSDSRVLDLSPPIGWLALGAASAGLLVTDLYRDNIFVQSAWKGCDQVTLFAAIPLMTLSWAFARQGSARGFLALLGLLAYLLYSYAYFLVGAAFNALFLVYVLLVVLPAIALLAGLVPLDAGLIVGREPHPRRISAGYLFFVALGLSAVYVSQSIAFILTGQLPEIVQVTDHPTSIVFAIDLTLMVPALLFAGIRLWRGDAWGHVAAIIVTIAGGLYTGGLALGSYWAGAAGVPHAFAQLPLWIVLTAANVTVAIRLLSSVVRRGSPPEQP
jgi:hypothetical protein